MKFKLVRIDDRLIHGQVALGWSRSKGIDTIIAVDDAVAKDQFQCTLLKMATPAGVKSYILEINDAVKKLTDASIEHRSVMLLVKTPETLLHLIDQGVAVESINIGNMRSMPGKQKLLNYVYVDENEMLSLKELSKKGLEMYAQDVPNHSGINFNEILEKN